MQAFEGCFCPPSPSTSIRSCKMDSFNQSILLALFPLKQINLSNQTSAYQYLSEKYSKISLVWGQNESDGCFSISVMIVTALIVKDIFLRYC